jgi:tetratricopeptide (TPR) repeat protein
MMENIGLNSEVVVGGKKFHIQTQYLEPNEKIISNIFDDGKVLVTQELEIECNTPVKDIKFDINQMHQDMIADLEMIFFIAEKVRTVQHSASNNKLGNVFLKKNLFNEAIREFEKALEIDPGLGEVYNNLGYAYLKQKSYDKAIEAYLRGIEKNVDYADLHNNLGYAYFRSNKPAEAIYQIKIALQKNPKYVNAIFNLCLVYLHSLVNEIEAPELPSPGERIEAAKELLTGIVDQRQYFKTDYLETAIECLGNGDFAEAIKALEQAESDLPQAVDLDCESKFYLNFMFGGKGKDDDYIQGYTDELKTAVADHSGYADLRNNLGIAYLIQCRNLFLNALEEFRQALRINPEFKKADKNLKLAENDGKGFLILLRAILK